MLGVLLYYGLIFFYLDMSGIRQATSLSIFFFSIRYIVERKPLKYFLLLFIAFTFHWSVIFLFPFYWLGLIKFNKVVAGATILTAMIIYFVGVRWATNIIPSLFLLLQNTNYASKIVGYSTTEIFVTDRGINARTVIHLVMLITILIVSTKHYERLAKANPYYPFFHKILVVQLIMLLVLTELPEISERIKLYFYLSNIIILPSFLLLIPERLKKFIAISGIAMYALFYGNVHILEKPITIAYYPYQNYLVYKLFGLHSTGDQRLDQHMSNMEGQ
jgi:hypothetical protein